MDGCMGPTRRTCCGTAATFTCAGRTACSPISWPWWWTMPAWGHRGGARVGPAVLHGAAAVPVPSAGPAGSSLCPLPAAAGPGRAAAVQAGTGTRAWRTCGKNTPRRRSWASWPMPTACSRNRRPARRKASSQVFPGKGAQAGRLPAGGAVLNQTTTKGGSAPKTCAAALCFMGHCPAVSGRGILKGSV